MNTRKHLAFLLAVSLMILSPLEISRRAFTAQAQYEDLVIPSYLGLQIIGPIIGADGPNFPAYQVNFGSIFGDSGTFIFYNQMDPTVGEYTAHIDVLNVALRPPNPFTLLPIFCFQQVQGDPCEACLRNEFQICTNQRIVESAGGIIGLAAAGAACAEKAKEETKWYLPLTCAIAATALAIVGSCLIETRYVTCYRDIPIKCNARYNKPCGKPEDYELPVPTCNALGN
jgi:hypothetical protein